MRILIVTHYFPPEVGAPQARLSEFAKCWADAGDDVTVLTGLPNHPTGVVPPDYRGRWRVEEQTDGYRIVRTWLFATPNEGFAKKTFGHLSFMMTSVLFGCRRAGPADVVLVSSPTFFSIFSAWILARFKHATFVIEIRDLWPAIFISLGILRNKHLLRLLEALELWAYHRADAIIVVTEGFRDYLLRRDIRANKIHVIRNGVDLKNFGPKEVSNRDPTRVHLGARPGQCLVLYLGAHGISQGLDSVIAAAAELEDDLVHFALVGEGAAKIDLIDQVANLGLTNVTLLPGVPRTEVPSLLDAADVCLVVLRDIPLFSSFIPSKLFEYLGSQNAVIGAVRGESATILRESGATVVEPGDPSALARAIHELARNPKRRAEMGARGRSHMEAHFDRNVQGAQYRSIISQSVASAAPVTSLPNMTTAQNMHFSERAALWDARYQSSPSFQARMQVISPIIEKALLRTGGGARVLDFGGGTGVFARHAAQWSSFIVCLDRSMEMLSEGRKHLQGNDTCVHTGASGGPASIHWVAGDYRCLAATSSPFDLVLAIAVLEYIPDVHAVLQHFATILAPDGELLLTVPNPRSAFRIAQRIGRRVMSINGFSFVSKCSDQSYLDIRPYGDYVPWREGATKAGLTIDRIYNVPLGTRYPRVLLRPTLLASLRHAAR